MFSHFFIKTVFGHVLQMPVLDGLEATRLIRESEVQHQYSHKPIIGLTAHAIQGYRDRCLDAGMDAYACKPFQAKDLIQVIQKVCKKWAIEPKEVEAKPTIGTVAMEDQWAGKLPEKLVNAIG